MARDFFKNLPNTTTPLTATRINGLLDGDEAMGNIVVDSIRSKNMFNKETAIRGKLVSRVAGTIDDNSNFYASDFISIEENTTFTLTNCNPYYTACYNASKTYIGYMPNANTMTTLEGTKYIRITIPVDNINTAQMELGSTASNYAEYKELGFVSGSNSNGNYIKYNDGTLIQYGTIDKSNFIQSGDVYSTIQGIKFYRSASFVKYMPINFINTDYKVFPNAQQDFTSGASRLGTIRIQKSTEGSFEIQVIGVEPYTTSGNGYINLLAVDWLAIGKWK